MNYEILYDESQINQYQVIQRDAYNGGKLFIIHSRHAELETAELVKEALEARQRAENDRA